MNCVLKIRWILSGILEQVNALRGKINNGQRCQGYHSCHRYKQKSTLHFSGALLLFIYLFFLNL